ncbi:methyl-accepting chemotaxis protein [Moritella sp. Urea-trap-13]|uniref:methyl-accepting chemotaxis protein n=1 Tax=Moritella sp. Urea-trap-13 TaxID=2058327 RepID=UPI001E3D61A1|nr:methyl-accepting chemotaxis protein [Moritella sp. Urea-trap-13]
MKMNKITLKARLVLTASIAVFIGAGAVGATSYLSSKNRIENETLSRIENTAHSYNKSLTDWLSSKSDTLNSMPEKTPLMMIRNTLKIIKNAGSFENVFFAYPDGQQKNADDVELPEGNDDPREWGWYKNASMDDIFMDNPTVAAATGDRVVSMSRAMTFYNSYMVIGADVKIDILISNLAQTLIPGNGKIFVVSNKGEIFADVNTALINKRLTDISLDNKYLNNEQPKLYNDMINGIDSAVYVAPIKGTNLRTIIVIDRASITQDIRDNAFIQLFAALGVSLIVSLFMFLFIQKLLNPLLAVTKSLKEIAAGDGDLTHRLDANNEDEIGELSQAFNDVAESQRSLVEEVKHQATMLKSMAEISKAKSHENSNIIKEQQIEVSMVATAINEMTTATVEIARNAEEAASSAQASSESAQKGIAIISGSIKSIGNLSTEIKQTSDVVEELNSHVLEINSILVAIQTIADQTNLLALNAAIEAARAGDAGRGFAVVADEVRTLSQKTHRSTGEIQKTIQTLQDIVGKATVLMKSSEKLALSTVSESDLVAESFNDINVSIQKISDMSTQIATAVEQQTAVTGEISENVNNINSVSDILSDNSIDANEQSNVLNTEANKLYDSVSIYTV